MVDHVFGGDWTERKLGALKAYLEAYRLIFTRNEKARHFKTIYIDAFAGTGSRKEVPQGNANSQQDFFETEDQSEQPNEYRNGSAKIALSLDSPFDEYIFVDKNADHANDLRALISQDFPHLKERCKVWEADGCDVMRELCTYRHWDRERAVAFLDPYGMNVEWQLLEWIAKTKAIDLWLLWPLGMGANRLLKRDKKPHKAFSEKLTRVFGTVGWEQEFYSSPPTLDLFEESPASLVKDTDFESIGNLYLSRLKTIFAGVAPKTKVLKNSRGNPMYLLFFASANAKGAIPAVKIANYLMDD